MHMIWFESSRCQKVKIETIGIVILWRRAHTQAPTASFVGVVIGFYGDLVIDRHQKFVTMLMRHWVQIDALFHHSGFHAIEIVGSKWLNAIVEMIKDFIVEIKNKP